MANKSTILVAVFAIILISIASFSYYKYEVLGDFNIKFKAPCDPSTEECLQEEGDCASADLGCVPVYYKMVEQKAGK